MRVLFLASLVLAQDANKEEATPYTPIPGACSQTTMLPPIDEPCSSSNGKGSFDAAGKSLKSAQDCAQYAKEQCNTDGEKAVYVTYSGGEFNFNKGTGLCSWFAGDQCACLDAEKCGGPHTAAGAEVENTVTGSIKELLSEAGNGIPVQRGADEPAKVNDEITDQAYALKQQELENREKAEPEAAKLSTIPTAEELNLEAMRKDPMSIQKVQEDSGEVEPSCPPDQVAVQREEWQCIALSHGGLYMGPLMGYLTGSILTGAVVAGFVHMQGKSMRLKAGGAGSDAGDAASEDDA